MTFSLNISSGFCRRLFPEQHPKNTVRENMFSQEKIILLRRIFLQNFSLSFIFFLRLSSL